MPGKQLDKDLFDATARTFLFIDGPNSYQAAKALGFSVDFKKLYAGFRTLTKLVRIYYYTPAVDSEEYSSVRPLLDWLDYNGYTVVTKPLKESSGGDSNRRVEGKLGIELTIDACKMAMLNKMDHMILFTGNADYRPLVEAVKDLGVVVTVVSTKETNPPFVADELRRACDRFIDLKYIGIEDDRVRRGT